MQMLAAVLMFVFYATNFHNLVKEDLCTAAIIMYNYATRACTVNLLVRDSIEVTIYCL